MNRTARYIQRLDAPEAAALRETVGASEVGILGNGQGAVSVTPNDALQYSIVWFRFRDSSDVNETTGFGLPLRGRVERDLPLVQGVPVRVTLDKVTNTYVILGLAYEEINRRGINTALTWNSHNPSNQQLWLRRIRNARARFNGGLLLSIEPYYYIYKGTIKQIAKGISDAIDLSSHVPSAGNERLVGIAVLPEDNTAEVVAGTTRAITDAAWPLSALQELINTFSDTAIPLQAIPLKAGTSALYNNASAIDFRPFLNTSGVGIGSPTITPIKTVSTDYTVTVADDTIIVNASGGAVTITLPAATTTTGQKFNIKAKDVSGGVVTVDGNASETIDGHLTQILNTQYDSITIQSDGTEWCIL